MRFVSWMKFAAAAAPIAVAAPALAGPTNLGFESDTLAGWMSNGGDAFVTGTISNSGGGSFDAAAEGDLFGGTTAGLSEGVYSTLSQSFTLRAGGTITGYAGFLSNDYTPYNDDAYVSVNDIKLLTWDVAGVGDYGASGWIPFTFTATAAGVYTLKLAVANRLDNNQSSQAVIDGVQVSGAVVPEPASWALMVLGFGFAGTALRSRRRQVSFG
jgi:hypothetical protein